MARVKKVTEIVATAPGTVNINEVCAYIDKHLYDFTSTSKALAYTWNAQENIILFGIGGYGKQN